MVTLNFYWNQSEIVELFCLNKEKPELKCNGKCHLNTVLSETDTSNEVPFAQNNTEYNLELIFDVANDTPSTVKKNNSKNKWITLNTSILERDSEILSPPPKV